MTPAPGLPRQPSRWTYLPEFALSNLPRYTSYPPANRYRPDISEADVRSAIRALPSETALSLYVHVPYCRQLCWYCGCHTSVPTVSDPVEPYLAALLAEIDMVARLAPAGARVTHLHFGGGSPDLLRPYQIDLIFQRLRSGFQVAPDAEIAAELDPRGATGDVVAAYAANGLSRASLGVQVLNAAVQARINRIQPRGLVEDVVKRLRAHGVSAVNLDIMYGLPGQTRDHVEETARFAANMDANRVAAFGYAHLPWFKKHQAAIRPEDLPGAEERFRQAETAADTLICAGYAPIGFDHFAAPGDSLVQAERQHRLRRNFQGYTDDSADALIGFGASAISTLPALAWQNAPNTAAYRQSVAAGALPIFKGLKPTAEDKRIGRIIERILCRFEAEIPQDMRDAASSALTALSQAKLISWAGHRLLVAEQGRPYVRNIAAAFDPDLRQVEPGKRRHSLAI